MTIREILNAYRGYDDKRNKEYQGAWERTRWLGAVIASSMGTKKVQPTDLMKFPWESKKVDRTDELKLLEERRKWLTKQQPT
jgi:hypothetical protein